MDVTLNSKQTNRHSKEGCKTNPARVSVLGADIPQPTA
jgi:hypothetical protein